MNSYHRSINILKEKSFFLFGARGTGKTALLRRDFSENDPRILWFDLLDPKLEAQLVDHPSHLLEVIDALPSSPEWVIIDEVQKAPKLLDIVHQVIESRSIRFALTGSSARKLKRGGANLLAGRALLNYLYPLTVDEIADDFNLKSVLTWGSLPSVVTSSSPILKTEILESYVQTYLKEEVVQEQLVRNLTPFRKFLGIAAQSTGTLLNYKEIADDLTVDWASVRNYFEILEDTLIGFSLPAYDTSLRKQQLKSSKFYLFDIGVKRVLDNTISVIPETGQQIGPLFEHFLIAEIYRLNHYRRTRYQLSQIATRGGLEVDLVIERPGEKTVIIEIKSSESIQDKHLKHLRALVKDFPDRFEAMCLCREQHARVVDGILVAPWRFGLQKINLID